MKKTSILLLTSICLLGFFLRIYHVDKIPNSISADEAAFGYNAYSILQTNKDEFGHTLPLFFQSFDDHKNPVFVYLLVPFIKYFGLNDTTIRLPSVFIGTLLIYLFFLLTREFTHNIKLALTTSLFAAISPWLIAYSRIALEIETAVFLTLLGIWIFLKGKNNRNYYIFAGVIFGLSFWTYYASKLFLIIFLPVLYLFHKKITRYSILSLAIFTCIMLPNIITTKSNNLLRQYGISVFANQEDRNRDARLALYDQEQNTYGGIFIHNRRITFINQALEGYLQIINPHLLFGQSSQNQIPITRLFYIWQLPLLLLGIFYVYKNRSIFWLMIAFIIIGYIPGGITALPVFDRRIHIISYPLILLIALGFLRVIEWSNKQPQKMQIVTTKSLILLISISFFIYLHNYFIHGKNTVVELWGNGMKQIVLTTNQKKLDFDHVIVSLKLNQPLIFFLYYLTYSPKTYLAEGGTISGGYLDERNHFDTYQFRFITPKTLSKKNLYVWPLDEPQPCLRPIVTTILTNGNPYAHIGIYDPYLSTCFQ